MLIVKSPSTRIPERNYIYQVILKQFMGLDYAVWYEDRDDIELSLYHEAGRSIRIVDIFLQMKDEDWLKPASIPQQALDHMETADSGSVPVIYGLRNSNGHYIEIIENGIRLGIDLFGSCFFMLTRYEELTLGDKDAHHRFPASKSLAFKEGFLNRPIVNEYVELLWQQFAQLWPMLKRKPRKSRVLISHDVDFPFYTYGRNRLRIVKDSLSELIRRQDLESAWKKARMVIPRRNNLTIDPFNTFDWLMDLSEQIGVRSSFYFMVESLNPLMDSNYSIEDKNIVKLMRNIYDRGHEIGLHPGYDTYNRQDRIQHQFSKLLNIAQANGIHQDEWGGRQHYLRWSAPETWQYWEDAGLHYDSTLGYAEHIGFRSGTCYEYPAFNVLTRQKLKLRERPLVVMEQTILESKYMGLQSEQALQEIMNCYKQCLQYDGDFTLLWHNSQLMRSEDRDLYQQCLKHFANPS